MTRKPPATYTKANSFTVMTGADSARERVGARIDELGRRLPGLTLDDKRRRILDLACRALAGRRAEGEPEFELLPHIVAELDRIDDADLPRYLFYRYRYDVYPATLQDDAFPPCVQIEPASVCNFRCVFCYQTDSQLTAKANGHMGMMSLDTFKQVVDQIAGEVEAVSLASRGEPLVCKDIDAMLAYAAGKFLGLKINTNASLLDERRAHAILSAEPNTVVFSADAADPELYGKLRVNGNFEKVAANVRRFAEIKRTHYPNSRTITRVSGVKFTDQQDFAAVDAFWHDYVDQVAFVSYNPWENAYQQPANGIATPCSDLWRRTFVWWDGRLNPCDVDYRSTLSVGNVLDTPLSTLWQGEAYRALRNQHRGGGRQCRTPCAGCSVL